MKIQIQQVKSFNFAKTLRNSFLGNVIIELRVIKHPGKNAHTGCTVILMHPTPLTGS